MPKVKINFTTEEKTLLLEFVRRNANVIENHANEIKVIKAKKEKWNELSNLFKSRGFNRDWQRLREYYQRAKCNAKSTVSKYHMYQNGNGNGIGESDLPPPDPPTEFDWAIHHIGQTEYSDYIPDTSVEVGITVSDSEPEQHVELNNEVKREYILDEDYLRAQIDFLEKRNRREQELHEAKMKVEQMKMRNEELLAEKLKLEIEHLRK